MASHNVLKTLLFLSFVLCTSSFYDGPIYDSSAYTECMVRPEEPLYGGGMLIGQNFQDGGYLLRNLIPGNKYCLSIWIKITSGIDSALITTSLKTVNDELPCIGTVIAKQGCWSFLKGGFELSSPSILSKLSIQSSDGKNVSIEAASASLQPFTDEQWTWHQQVKINEERKRAVAIHVTNRAGMKIQGAHIKVKQVSKDFPFGAAIAYSIIGNLRYQHWFAKRFNVAVFENELKWLFTEPLAGIVNYTIPDQMLEFLRVNRIMARGHTVLWEIKEGNPYWVRDMNSSSLQAATESRIQSLMTKYSGEFIHWDVMNEDLHYDFYKVKLGDNSTLQFFEKVHQLDPLALLFMNEFNVIEGCMDNKSTVDSLILRLKELRQGGALMEGIGLQSHFGVPNLPLMRGILDKLATLNLPIWLTEVDINSKFDHVTQAKYLDMVLREGFSHPAVDGIVIWSALSHLRPSGCYQMCLTDDNFHNLPTGDVVDSLLKEWRTGSMKGLTDKHGVFSFTGFLGEYMVKVEYENKKFSTIFSLSKGSGTKHLNVVV